MNINKFKNILLLVFVYLLISAFNSCSERPPQNNSSNKVNCCDTSKPVGKVLSAKEITPVDSVNLITTKNLNALHRYGAGSFVVAGDSGTILITPNAGLNWSTPSSGTTKHLYGCSITDYDTMHAAGESGTILRSKDKGVTWSGVQTNTGVTLRSIYFPTKFTGYSAGDSGKIIKTTDAGNSWNLLYSNDSTGNIRSVYFADSITGWFCSSNGRIYKTINGGLTWITQYNNLTDVLNCVSFNGNLKGTTVGNNGKILETNNGGNTWNASSFNPSADLYSVHRVNNDLAFLCGNGKIIRESSGTFTEILNNQAYNFKAVDPDPYIMGLAVADLGLIKEVNVAPCDCGDKNDLVMLPTEYNHKWRITIRLNDNSAFRDNIRIIVPGFEIDNSVLTGWTQTDQIENPDPNISYQLSSSGNPSNPVTNAGGYVLSGINDAATINLNHKNSAYITLDLTPTSLNTSNVGSVNFFYGNSGNNYCASVKYILSN